MKMPPYFKLGFAMIIVAHTPACGGDLTTAQNAKGKRALAGEGPQLALEHDGAGSGQVIYSSTVSGSKHDGSAQVVGSISPEQYQRVARPHLYLKDKYLYDAGQVASEARGLDKRGDTFRLSYTPANDEYHAVYAWD